MEDLLFFEPIQHSLAKKRLRFSAAFIDYFVYVVVCFIIGYTIGEKYTPAGGGIGFHLSGFPALVSLLIWFLMFPVLESLKGQTLGKVTRINYSKSSLSQSIIRHLFDFVDYLPFLGIVGLIVASSNALKQRVGDIVAKTVVIDK
jgi:uncharacterized RDD family membrane protein YckC